MPAADRGILRDAVTISTAVGIVGLSFGVIAAAKGVSFLQTQAMSVLVFAGGSQFVLVAGVGTGIGAALIAALLLNARHVAFGLSVAPFLKGPLWQRALSSQLVIDESSAYALAQTDPRRSRRGFYAVGTLLFIFWQVGTAVGALAGSAIDYRAFGVDAAFPAGLLALLGPQLRSRPTQVAALTGAMIGVASTPVLPHGAPLMLASLGAVAGVVTQRRLAGS